MGNRGRQGSPGRKNCFSGAFRSSRTEAEPPRRLPTALKPPARGAKVPAARQGNADRGINELPGGINRALSDFKGGRRATRSNRAPFILKKAGEGRERKLGKERG